MARAMVLLSEECEPRRSTNDGANAAFTDSGHEFEGSGGGPGWHLAV